jgi:hypothetical protein
MSLFVPRDPVMDALTDAATQEMQRLTEALYGGRIEISQWSMGVADTLKDLHLSNAMVAVGGSDNLGFTEYGRIGGTLSDEYRHLYDFAQGIANGEVSEAQALARISQYGQASQQSFWKEYILAQEKLEEWADLPVLSQSPGDGSTQCHGNCNCTLDAQDDGIHWELNPGENCDDCLSLAAGGPYRAR